jgi:predicted nucleotide-binding protein
MPSRLLFVDDEQLATTLISTELGDAGFVVDTAASVDAAIRLISSQVYDLVVVDVMMPPGSFDVSETKGGFETGIVLARHVRRLAPRARLVGLTQIHRPETERWFTRFADGFWRKSDILADPSLAVRRVDRLLDTDMARRLTAFIVHGRSLDIRDDLRRLLTDSGLSVLVLDEQPWFGRTVIEKFEEVAADVDVVFVVLTGNDVIHDADGRIERHARQNVFVELGYFMGRFTRDAGKIVLLATADVAIPSDLHGVGMIDISNGVETAFPSIQRELTRLDHGR